MKVFFDTEFTGLHKNTTLISIGMINEKGSRIFYAELWDYDRWQVNEWIEENVLANLIFKEDLENRQNKFIEMEKKESFTLYVCGSKRYVRDQLYTWLEQLQNPVELVADVGYYDMVLLIDIFGDAFSLPENVSPTCHDINQDIAAFLGISESEAFNVNRDEFAGFNRHEKKKHNALCDARVIKMCYERIHGKK